MNPVKLAARFVASLPRDTLSPETTEGREGFVHPYEIEGGAEAVDRDADRARPRRRAARGARSPVAGLAEEAVAASHARGQRRRWEQYRNMREALDRVPDVVEAALEATRRVGLEPRLESIRGGTDGARLTELRPADPERLHGRERFPLGAGVDQRAGPGDLGRRPSSSC